MVALRTTSGYRVIWSKALGAVTADPTIDKPSKSMITTVNGWSVAWERFGMYPQTLTDWSRACTGKDASGGGLGPNNWVASAAPISDATTLTGKLVFVDVTSMRTVNGNQGLVTMGGGIGGTLMWPALPRPR